MDDTVEMVDAFQSALLPEILCHIFSFLPVTDRKSVRLTCRSWYEYSVRRNVIENEKYVFRTDSSVEEIAEFLLRSNYSQLNLEFRGVRVEELPADVWKVCGERIRTLAFHKCRWNVESFRNVILFCTNLTSFDVKSITLCYGATCPSSSSVLDDLIERGVRRTKLRTLAIFNNSEQLSDSVINKVCMVFPDIKHFGTGLVDFQIPFISRPTLHLERSPVSFRLDQCFNSETRLESLTLNFPMDANWMETLVQRAEKGIRLKKLEMKLIYRRSMRYSLFDFFKSLKNLEVLKLEIGEANADENKTLFFHILDNCPNLQKFFLETEAHCKIYLERSELPRFIASSSKLKFLSAVFDVDQGIPAPLYNDLLLAKPVQLDLTSLRWDNLNSDFSAAFLQRCPSLLHLYFSGVCHDAALQIIFQFLVELRTLVLYGIQPSCTSYGFTGRGVDGREEGYSIKRLKQLKYLKLQGAGSHLTEELTLELQLPSLESLSLAGRCLTEPRIERTLSRYAFHLPELRLLDCSPYHLRKMNRCECQAFTKLHRRACCESFFYRNYEMSIAEKIFRSCPRLRYIGICGSGVIHHDPFTRKVALSDSVSFTFPENVFEV